MGRRVRYRGKKGPQAICDRTGRKYPYSEMVLEPGTHFFVHYTQTDGKWNKVDHPQNKPPMYRREGVPLPNARPDTQQLPTYYYLVDQQGSNIIDNFGNYIVYQQDMV